MSLLLSFITVISVWVYFPQASAPQVNAYADSAQTYRNKMLVENCLKVYKKDYSITNKDGETEYPFNYMSSWGIENQIYFVAWMLMETKNQIGNQNEKSRYNMTGKYEKGGSSSDISNNYNLLVNGLKADGWVDLMANGEISVDSNWNYRSDKFQAYQSEISSKLRDGDIIISKDGNYCGIYRQALNNVNYGSTNHFWFYLSPSGGKYYLDDGSTPNRETLYKRFPCYIIDFLYYNDGTGYSKSGYSTEVAHVFRDRKFSTEEKYSKNLGGDNYFYADIKMKNAKNVWNQEMVLKGDSETKGISLTARAGDDNSQRWCFRKVDYGNEYYKNLHPYRYYYKISCYASNSDKELFLTEDYNAKIKLAGWDENNRDLQLWRIEDTGDGYRLYVKNHDADKNQWSLRSYDTGTVKEGCNNISFHAADAKFALDGEKIYLSEPKARIINAEDDFYARVKYVSNRNTNGEKLMYLTADRLSGSGSKLKLVKKGSSEISGKKFSESDQIFRFRRNSDNSYTISPSYDESLNCGGGGWTGFSFSTEKGDMQKFWFYQDTRQLGDTFKTHYDDIISEEDRRNVYIFSPVYYQLKRDDNHQKWIAAAMTTSINSSSDVVDFGMASWGTVDWKDGDSDQHLSTSATSNIDQFIIERVENPNPEQYQPKISNLRIENVNSGAKTVTVKADIYTHGSCSSASRYLLSNGNRVDSTYQNLENCIGKSGWQEFSETVTFGGNDVKKGYELTITDEYGYTATESVEFYFKSGPYENYDSSKGDSFKDYLTADLGYKFYATLQCKFNADKNDKTLVTHDSTKSGDRTLMAEESVKNKSEQNQIFTFTRQSDSTYVISQSINGKTQYLIHPGNGSKAAVYFSENVPESFDDRWHIEEHKYDNTAYYMLRSAKYGDNSRYSLMINPDALSARDDSANIENWDLAYYELRELEAGEENITRFQFSINKVAPDFSGDMAADERTSLKPGAMYDEVKTTANKVNFGGHSYEAFNYAVTQEQAAEICKAKGGQLVSINSEAEAEAVQKLVEKYMDSEEAMSCGYDNKWQYWIANTSYVSGKHPGGADSANSGLAVSRDGEAWSWENQIRNNLPGGFVCEYSNEFTDYEDFVPENEENYYNDLENKAFWAYIKLNSDDIYLSSPKQYKRVTDGTYTTEENGKEVSHTKYKRVTTPAITNECTTESAKRKQVNFWRFEYQEDGSFLILSCTLDNGYLVKENGYVKDEGQAIIAFDENTSKPSAGAYWFIVREGDHYKLRNRATGKYLTIAENNIGFAEYDNGNAAEKLDIVRTDLTVQAAPTNVTLDLFDYGRRINDGVATQGTLNASVTADIEKKLLLNFRDTARYGVDGSSNYLFGSDFVNDLPNETIVNQNRRDYGQYIDYLDHGIIKSLAPVLVNEAPYITDYTFTNEDTFSGGIGYLFDTNMGKDTNGFVQGSGKAKNYNPFGGMTRFNFTDARNVPMPYPDNTNYANYPATDAYSYDYTKLSHKENADYYSQHFEITDLRSLFTLDEDGYYRYNSATNAAVYVPSSEAYNKGSFKIFDYGFRTNIFGDTGADFREGDNGNFYPFNVAHKQGKLNNMYMNNENTYEVWSKNGSLVENGINADDNDSRRVTRYKIDSNDYMDRLFGLKMETEFTVSSDYQFNGKDMQFYFSGDDDVWVYIDDVLMLDISGIHGTTEGLINFKTGKAGYVNEYIQYSTAKGEPQWYDIEELFNKAASSDLATPEQKEAIKSVKFVKREETDENGNVHTYKVFEPGSKHTLKFFYLERGGWLANNTITYALPSAFATVKKEVTGVQEGLDNGESYKFKFAYADDRSPIDVEYQVTNEDTSVVGEKKKLEKETDESGNTYYYFELKNHEKADLTGNINEGESYTIEEITGENCMYTTSWTSSNNSGKSFSSTGTKATGLPASYNYPCTTVFANERTDTKETNLHLRVVNETGAPITDIKGATYVVNVDYYRDGKLIKTENVNLFGNNAGANGTIDLSLGKIPNDVSIKTRVTKALDSAHAYEDGYGMHQSGFAEIGNSYSLSDSTAVFEGAAGAADTYIQLVSKAITVEFMYYDRADESSANNKPANLKETATKYPVSVDVNNVGMKSSIQDKLDDIVATAWENTEIGNILDEYKCFVSNDAATSETSDTSLRNLINPRTGKPYSEDGVSYDYNYHTSRYAYPKGTDEYSQQIGDDESKWVTYYDENGNVFDPQGADSKIDDVKKIVVWLYNSPRKYTVTEYSSTSVADYKEVGDKLVAIEKDTNKKEHTAYHNQRFGTPVDVAAEDASTEYLKNYGLTKDNAGYVNDSFEAEFSISNSSGTRTTTYKFLYWAADPEGKHSVSTERYYYYRAVRDDLTLYAVYGEAGEKPIGNRTEFATTDKFRGADSEGYARLNVILNPYGAEHNAAAGTGTSKKLTDVAIYYIQRDSVVSTANDAFDLLEAVKTALGREDQKLSGYKYNKQILRTGGTNGVQLTAHNRLQFTLKVKANSLLPGKSFENLAAVTAYKYNGVWYVSDNVIGFNQGKGYDVWGKIKENEPTVALASYAKAMLNTDEGIYGDTDLDGKLSIKDATEMQKTLAGFYELSPRQKYYSDLNEDGIINISDVTALQKQLAGA